MTPTGRAHIRWYAFRHAPCHLCFAIGTAIVDCVCRQFVFELRGRCVHTDQIVSIVDDDESVRVTTASLVRSFGCQTRVFASAEEFLRSADIDKTACLISDVRMPGMSGIEMHARLLELGYKLPTVFITAFPTADLHARILADGALACLAKPVDPAAISHWLNLVLGTP